MSSQAYPRIVTIPVPTALSLDKAGDYATSVAHQHLINEGLGVLVPNSANMEAVSERLYVLTYRTHKAFSEKISVPVTSDPAISKEENAPIPAPMANRGDAQTAMPKTGASTVRPKGRAS